MAAGDVVMARANNTALTITLASLASDASLLTGRESNSYDLSNYLDADLNGQITLGTTPTTAKEIRVGVVGIFGDNSTWPDVFDGTDSAETISQTVVRDGVLKWAYVTTTVATSNQAYPFGPISVASLFNGVLPRKIVVFVTHSTAVNLNSTAGNHFVNIAGTYIQNLSS